MPNVHVPLIPDAARRLSAAAFIASAVATIALTALTALGARSWIDQPFAGFFLRADRTVAAVGRNAWTDVAARDLYDRTLLAVDGRRIADADALHRRVAAKPIGSPLTYTVTDGTTVETVTVRSRRFSAADYWAVFGAYAGTGLCWLLLAIAAAWTLPSERIGRALLLLGGVGGVYMLTAADLYPPAGSLRMHVLAAALLPAALLQFALAVGDARGRFAAGTLPVVWAASLAAAASLQLAIGDPAATRVAHATCDAALGLALVSATIGLAARVRLAKPGAPLVAATALVGLGLPAVVFLLAGIVGNVPHNASATLAFLFPLGMSAALWRRDLPLAARDVARSHRSL
ncbi:MAG: hypothetical protein IT293_08560 [Deltaproteobacteria bacterium]|nr:hypothetical protein [Deltaproteobacteria bacterium]